MNLYAAKFLLSIIIEPQLKKCFKSNNITNEWSFCVILKLKEIFLFFLLILILKFPSASVIPVTHQGERLQVLLVCTDLNDLKFLTEYILLVAFLYYVIY